MFFIRHRGKVPGLRGSTSLTMWSRITLCFSGIELQDEVQIISSQRTVPWNEREQDCTTGKKIAFVAVMSVPGLDTSLTLFPCSTRLVLNKSQMEERSHKKYSCCGLKTSPSS